MKNMLGIKASGVLVAVATVVAVGSASATPIVWTGSSGSLAAQVTFNVSGNDLLVTLANTSTADPSVPADILTGVFFTIPGAPSLGRVSAVLTAGSSVIHGPATSTDPGNVVGGEWAYLGAISGPGSSN